jgi:hypothetical protein
MRTLIAGLLRVGAASAGAALRAADEARGDQKGVGGGLAARFRDHKLTDDQGARIADIRKECRPLISKALEAPGFLAAEARADTPPHRRQLGVAHWPGRDPGGESDDPHRGAEGGRLAFRRITTDRPGRSTARSQPLPDHKLTCDAGTGPCHFRAPSEEPSGRVDDKTHHKYPHNKGFGR